MLTICNRNTSPIESKMSVLPLDKRIADFQFAFTGQQYYGNYGFAVSKMFSEAALSEKKESCLSF